MSKKAQKSLEQAVRKLKSYKPERVILFGSYAWGTPGKGSDLDLFIVKKTKKRKIERTHEVTKLVGELPLPFDLLIYTPEEISKRLRMGDTFVANILANGKVLYERSKAYRIRQNTKSVAQIRRFVTPLFS